MARIGAEAERRQALIEAAIQIIGANGSLDVPVKDIARRAGMSTALAFHYFGGKDEIVIETMRYLLRELSREMVDALKRAGTAAERVDAIIKASFTANQFDRNTIAAWLVFYLRAYSSSEAARLLSIYTARLRSNLVHALDGLLPAPRARLLAEGLGSLIDGIYIRQALRKEGPNAAEAVALCRDFVRAGLQMPGSAEQELTGVH